MDRNIFSLDIDKDRVICASASIDSKDRITSFYIEKKDTSGIEKGKVTDLNHLTKSIKDCVNGLQEKTGNLKINKFYVNILSKDIKLKSTFGIIPLRNGGDKIVTTEDIDKVIQITCSLNLNKDERLLHKITKRFILDDKITLKDPINLYGHKLGVELSLLTLPVSDIENIAKAIHNAGFEVEDFVFSGLSTSLVVMPEDREKFILIDMRRDLTQMLYFDNKILKDLKIFDFGSEDLIETLARSLDLSFSLAEELKETYGSLEKIRNKEEIFIKTDYSYKPIKREKISSILYSSVNLILNSLKRKIPKDFYPEGLIGITGDIVFLEGFLELAESLFKLPVVMGRVNPVREYSLMGCVESGIKPISSVAFSNGVKHFLSLQDSVLSVGNFGLTLYGIKKSCPKTFFYSPGSLALRLLKKLKNIYQDYF